MHFIRFAVPLCRVAAGADLPFARGCSRLLFALVFLFRRGRLLILTGL